MSARVLAIAFSVFLLLVAIGTGIRQFAIGPDGFPSFRPATVSDLQSRSDAKLYFPNSVVIRVETEERQLRQLVSAGFPARVSTHLAAEASEDEIRVWYGGQLRSRGWTFVPTSNGPKEDWWKRGSRELFGLYFVEPGSVAHDSANRSTEYVANYAVG
jgi:hypothetical protein